MRVEGAAEVVGTLLRSHHHWLGVHAKTSDNKQLRCKTTGVLINTQVDHRFQMGGREADVPFLPEALLDNKTQSGRVISFTSYWCPECDERPSIPDRIFSTDIICL